MKHYLALLLTVLVLMNSSVEARKGGLMEEFSTPQEEKIEPWFTGPLLAPSGHVVPVGYMNIEPYVFTTVTYAQYDKHGHAQSVPNVCSVNPEVPLQFGLTKWMDVTVTPAFVWNSSQHRSATRFGDFPIALGFQLLMDKADHWWPAIKIAIRESFPTGKYEKLNPEKLGLDISGSGAYVTSIGFAMSRLFWFGGAHYLAPRLGVGYYFPSAVHVKGFNAYGGGHGTHGTVYPGHTLNAVLGLEFSLTRRWVLACDIFNTYSARTRFKGHNGVTATGAPAGVGSPSSEQLSLAPAIEYNWSDKLGVIAGCWFTVSGRNAGDFASAVIALNYFTAIGKEEKEKEKGAWWHTGGGHAGGHSGGHR